MNAKVANAGTGNCDEVRFLKRWLSKVIESFARTRRSVTNGDWTLIVDPEVQRVMTWIVIECIVGDVT